MLEIDLTDAALSLPAVLRPVAPPADLATPTEVEGMFTSRWCHVLALALHKSTGWPVVVVGDGSDGSVGWVHAGVRRPGGLIMDVRGSHAPDDWLDRWGEVVDTYGRHGSNPCHGGYDSDKVGIYGWEEIDADATILQDDRPPSSVSRIAATTAEELLARFAGSCHAANWPAPP